MATVNAAVIFVLLDRFAVLKSEDPLAINHRTTQVRVKTQDGMSQ